jgi:hypothetical protein
MPGRLFGNAGLGAALGQDQARRLSSHGLQRFASFDLAETPPAVDGTKHSPRLISTQIQPSFQVLGCDPNDQEIALQDLQLDSLLVIYPGLHPYPSEKKFRPFRWQPWQKLPLIFSIDNASNAE